MADEPEFGEDLAPEELDEQPPEPGVGTQAAKKVGQTAASAAKKKIAQKATKKTAEAAVQAATSATGPAGWAVKALLLFRKPWFLGANLIVILILLGLIVLSVAILFNAFSGKSGTKPPQAEDINDPEFIDRINLQKCLDEKSSTTDEEQEAGPPLSQACQTLIDKLKKDGDAEIASLKKKIEFFDDSEEGKQEGLKKLDELKTELEAVKNSNGTINTLKHAIKFKEKRQEFLTEYYKLIGCDNLEAIFTQDQANPDLYATPVDAGFLARYRNGNVDQDEWYVTKDFACYLIKVAQAWGEGNIELGEASGRGGSAASGHRTHFGGGVIDIWVPGFHAGNAPGSRERRLAEIITSLGAKYLLVGSYQGNLGDIDGVDIDTTGVHDDHWHICYSGC